MLFWVRQEDRRYYRAWLQKDLLGTICVFKSYGTLYVKSGKSECTVCENSAHAKSILREIFKRRKKQGYQLFPDDLPTPSVHTVHSSLLRTKGRKISTERDLFDMAE